MDHWIDQMKQARVGPGLVQRNEGGIACFEKYDDSKRPSQRPSCRPGRRKRMLSRRLSRWQVFETFRPLNSLSSQKNFYAFSVVLPAAVRQRFRLCANL